jgi:peptidoglycan/LPS O-acetylase OafA/YrhL
VPDFDELAKQRGVPEVVAVVGAALVAVVARAWFGHLHPATIASIAPGIVGGALLFSALRSRRAGLWSRLELAVACAGSALVAASVAVAVLAGTWGAPLLAGLTAWLVVAPRKEPEDEELTPVEAAEEARLQVEQERRRAELDRVLTRGGRVA